MHSIRSLSLVVAATFALLALSACGSPCHNGCARKASCETSLGYATVTNVDSCTTQCEQSAACANQSDVSHCLADMKCDNTLGYLAEQVACSSLCKAK